MKKNNKIISPGEKYQQRIVEDSAITNKLSHILNYYSGLQECPEILIKQMLNSQFNSNNILIVNLLLGVLMTFILFMVNDSLLQYISITATLLLVVIINTVFVWYYESSNDYKILNALIARLDSKKLKEFSAEMNMAKAIEKSKNR